LSPLLRLAIPVFVVLVATLSLAYAAIAWWMSAGPGSPCHAFRNDPLAVCRSITWSFGPSLPAVAFALLVLFGFSVLAAWAWRARTRRRRK